MLSPRTWSRSWPSVDVAICPSLVGPGSILLQRDGNWKRTTRFGPFGQLSRDGWCARLPGHAQDHRTRVAERPRSGMTPRVLIVTADIGAGHDLPAKLLADGIRERRADADVTVVDGLVEIGPVALRLARTG